MTEYENGAHSRLLGTLKADTAKHLSTKSDWSAANENRRGWDDMNTFLLMKEIYEGVVQGEGSK